MKILCDVAPKVCIKCSLYRCNATYTYGYCRFLDRVVKPDWANHYRLGDCPLIGLDEVGKDDSNDKEEENG